MDLITGGPREEAGAPQTRGEHAERGPSSCEATADHHTDAVKYTDTSVYTNVGLTW